MPKEKRYQSKTKVYHVMSRALNKQMLFDGEHDFLVCLNNSFFAIAVVNDLFNLAFCIIINN